MSWSDPGVVGGAGQMMASNPTSSMKGSGEGEACQHIAPFADVAGPRTGGEMSNGRRFDFAIWIDSAKQMVNDGVKVDAITEFGQLHFESIEPVEQVRAEAPFGNGLVEGGVGSRDQEDIDFGSGAANGPHGPVVEQAQKYGLQRHWHVADLVEEERAAVSLLDEPDGAAAPRAGECAVGITEELGLDQAFAKGGAIDGDEGAVSPLAAWAWRASCSLPVPVSPRMRIGIFRAAAVST